MGLGVQSLATAGPAKYPWTSLDGFRVTKLNVNSKIKQGVLRVIDENGGGLGLLSVGDCLVLARNRGVDFVGIGPDESPRVCQIIDYGQYRYQEALKKRRGREGQKEPCQLHKYRVRPEDGRNWCFQSTTGSRIFGQWFG